MNAIIFKGYGWDIYKTEEKRVHTGSNAIVFANHRACQGEGPPKDNSEPMNSWWVEDIKQECVMCGMRVPDNIQALIMLYLYGKETP